MNRKIIVIFGFIIIIYFQLFTQEPFKYEVRVDVMLIPIFAVDSKDEPVYDLKKEDIILYVNGRMTKIHQFQRFDFDYQNKDVKRKSLKNNVSFPVLKHERVIFIIIDALFNSRYGLKRSKKIAIDLVKNKSFGDFYIVLVYDPTKGLKYVIGPEKKGEKVIEQIKKLKLTPGYDIYRDLFSIRSGSQVSNMARFSADYESQINLSYVHKKPSAFEYGAIAKKFNDTISRLKYVFKTITRPKLVFLISEGPANFLLSGAVKKDKLAFSILFVQSLKNLVESINNGGCILYSINPGKAKLSDDPGLGDQNLMFLARESGGKYFEGTSNTKDIVSSIRKATAAYYELAFEIDPKWKQKMRIKLECKRKGITLHNIKHIEKEVPYVKMDEVQKKVFAINVVTSGTWSRVVSKVERVKYQTQIKTKKGEGKVMSVLVSLPKKLWDKTIDRFFITFDPALNKFEFDTKSKKVKEIERFDIRLKKNLKHYFVIIDPISTYGVFNEIK